MRIKNSQNQESKTNSVFTRFSGLFEMVLAPLLSLKGARKTDKVLTTALAAISVLVLLSASLTSVVSADNLGLVAEYHFEGNANDSSGNENNGTIYGATFVDGVIGKALSFNGVNDYVSIPASANLNSVGSSDFSALAWIKPTVSTSWVGRVISKGSCYWSKGWHFKNFGSGDIQFEISDGIGGGYQLITWNIKHFKEGMTPKRFIMKYWREK